MEKQANKKKPVIIWGEHELSPGQVHHWVIGELNIWCKRTDQEIQIAYKRLSANKDRPIIEKPPEDISWLRFALQMERSVLQISPIFPDRPVVVIPEASFTLKQGIQARIYVRVPIWLKIELVAREMIPLIEIPTVVLSNTWFGSFLEGELCYWISSGIRREIEPDPDRNYLAICPIELHNRSDFDLSIERLCLRTANLSLFFDGTQLWSDETKVTYKGKEAASQFDFSSDPPVEAATASIIAPPRSPIKRGLVAQAFSSLKDLPGIGIFIN